jgi:hypothetical protein
VFGFLSMAYDYESRKVARHEGTDFWISTARVTDSKFPFETAVSHPQYNDNKIIIVEQYEDIEAAISGHKKWVDVFTKNLPDYVFNIFAGEFEDVFEKEKIFRKEAG